MNAQEKPTPGSEKVLQFLRKFEKDVFAQLIPHFNLENPACATVVNHGDLWNNNMLFKLDPDTKAPAQCVVIDWQVC